MTFLQEDMLNAINRFVSNIDSSLEWCGISDELGDYDEEYKTWMWTFHMLREEIIKSTQEPLTTIKRVQNEMKRHARKNYKFYFSVNAIDEFLLTVL